jgi:superkiller protein 3
MLPRIFIPLHFFMTMKTKTLLIIVAMLLCGMAHAATKTFEREYTYRASDNDSKNSARAIATTEMRNILLREVGEYLHAERRSENGEYSEKISAITAGIVEMKVLDEKWDGAFYYIKAIMTIDHDEINRRIAEILNDKQKTQELEDARRRIAENEAEIARLKKELENTKTDYHQPQQKLTENKTGNQQPQEELKTDNQASLKKYIAATEKLSAKEYITKGHNAYYNNFYTLAIEYYQKSIDIEPDSVAYYSMGVVYETQQNYPQAIRCYQKAIDIAPNYAAAYNNMGVVYHMQKDYPQAIRCYQKATDIDLNYAALLYYNMGNAYYAQQYYPQAIEYWRKAIDIDPNDAAAYNNMGNAYSAQENYPQAIRCYQKSIDIDPNFAAAYNNMGYAYGKQGNTTKKVECFRKAASLGLEEARQWLKENGYE